MHFDVTHVICCTAGMKTSKYLVRFNNHPIILVISNVYPIALDIDDQQNVIKLDKNKEYYIISAHLFW